MHYIIDAVMKMKYARGVSRSDDEATTGTVCAFVTINEDCLEYALP